MRATLQIPQKVQLVAVDAFINTRPILIECLLFINKYFIMCVGVCTMELNEFLIEYLIGLWSLGALIKFNYLFSCLFLFNFCV